MTPVDEKAAAEKPESQSTSDAKSAGDGSDGERSASKRARPRPRRSEAASGRDGTKAKAQRAESGDESKDQRRPDQETAAEEAATPPASEETASERAVTAVADAAPGSEEPSVPDVGETGFSEEDRDRREEPESQSAEVERQPGPDPDVEGLATEILDYFLGTMGVVASTYIREDTEDGAVAFDIEGEDAGLLIGRRGDTLQALQFLVNMIINKQLDRPAYVMIDVEGYRERRQESLRSLADRAASRVTSSGKPFTLQPMSAGDRRIIHLALASHPQVRTESRGESDQRKVVVLPKR